MGGATGGRGGEKESCHHKTADCQLNFKQNRTTQITYNFFLFEDRYNFIRLCFK